jgi:glycerol-3-phosphate dehydrogenase
LNTIVLERESDVCEGTSKANSGIVHAGFDAMPGSLKAKMNVRGNEMIHELSSSNMLDFAFKETGAMVLCFDENDIEILQDLYDRGIANGVPDISIISGDEARNLEPSLSENVKAALVASTSGVVCPFEMTMAFAEGAFNNGVKFELDTEVIGISKEDDLFKVETSKNDTYLGKIVINAAGVYADVVHNMICESKMKIIPRRGEYHLLDKEAGTLVSRTIFQLPTKLGKGVLVTPTVHGNLLVGPSAENIDDKEDTATTSEILASIKEKASLSVDGIPFNKVITSFSGLRAAGETHDFIIEESEIECFIDVAGIESPGLTSAPAIGEYVLDIVKNICEKKQAVSDLNEKLKKEKTGFIQKRKGVVHFASLSRDEQNELINTDSSYGNIVCRCESVTEGEIKDSIHRPLGARTLDGVKRRTRAGMGRCQAGFCTPKVMSILSEELGIPMEEIRKN